MERSDLCECMLILKGTCEYFWRRVNDRAPRASFCACSEVETENHGKIMITRNAPVLKLWLNLVNGQLMLIIIYHICHPKYQFNLNST